MNKICLFGASGHGKVVKDIANTCGFEVEFFLDDNPKQNLLSEIPVLKSRLLDSYKTNKFIVTIGNNKLRKQVSLAIKSFSEAIIHKSSIVSVSKSAEILEGTVIMANVVINADVKIGKHVIINSAAVIEHDCLINDYVHVSPNATITGNVKIGEGTHIGAGVIVIPNISIGKWVTIGAGAVIIQDIPDYSVVVGNPGKIIKYNKNEI